jgi:hypothetical protein
VGPLRYNHQKAGEAEVSPWGDVQGRSLLNFTRKSGNCHWLGDGIERLTLSQSAVTALSSERTGCSLKSAYWESLGLVSSKIDCATLPTARTDPAEAGKGDQTAETIKPNE